MVKSKTNRALTIHLLSYLCVINNKNKCDLNDNSMLALMCYIIASMYEKQSNFSRGTGDENIS